MRRLLALFLALILAAGTVPAFGEDEIMLTNEMYARATDFPAPDETRLKRVLEKALRGEEITVGVIGGSITEGSITSAYKYCYAGRLKDWWSARFAGKLTFKNAGIGGTDSYLGVHRAPLQLFRYKPDLIIIEFSVNDWGNAFYQTSYDSLVQNALAQPNEPAVILLFMTMESGDSAVVQHSAVGEKYRLPMLSYKNAVLPEIQKGTFTWRDISPDNIHPNDAGHKLVSDILIRYLEDVIARLDSISGDVAPFNKANAKYDSPRILSSGSLSADKKDGYLLVNYSTRFPGNWQGGGKGSDLCFTLDACKNIGVLYQRFTSAPGGSVDVYVDGVKTATLNADFSDGWGDSVYAEEVFTAPEVQAHTLEFKPAPGCEGSFVVLGIMVS